MKKVIYVILAGILVGLLVAFALLYFEFGGVHEVLSPYRPEGLSPHQP